MACEDDTESNADIIRAARKRFGWSLDRLAQEVGTKRKQVTRWESGENEPGPLYAPLLEEKLGVQLKRQPAAQSIPPASWRRAEKRLDKLVEGLGAVQGDLADLQTRVDDLERRLSPPDEAPEP